MIALQTCPAGDGPWALPRDRCPTCGAAFETLQASGRGRLFASTLVTRAPDETFRALVPYRIGLVDLDEGPRLMAHIDGEPAIGAPLTGDMEERAGRLLPVFRPA